MLCSNQLSYVATSGNAGPLVPKRREFSRFLPSLSSRALASLLGLATQRRAFTIKACSVGTLDRPYALRRQDAVFRTLSLSILLTLFTGLWSSRTLSATAMTVLVTGANRGIGLEMVRQLEARGMNVIGTARNPDSAEELKATGATVLQLDVTDAASVAALGTALEGKKIDLLINNAGVGSQRAASLADYDFDKMMLTFDVNSIGPMRVTQALLPNLQAGQHKTVVSISSVMGSIERNGGGAYGYRASKAALNMMNKSLSLELAEEGFTCVVVHPGWVRTRMGGEQAPVTPEQSVAGLLDVISGLSTDDNGKFYDYQGVEIPW